MSLGIAILFILSLVCIIISFFQFKEKGILFNNQYIGVSKQERESMTIEHKRAYFRQSAIAFLLFGIAFLTFALESLLKLNGLMLIVYLLVIINVIYVIVSSANIAKKQRKDI